jgi:Ca2+-binding RTX toxin-like protein
LLSGDSGDDFLYGGLGNDTIVTGSGADTVHFDDPPQTGGIDTITDFDPATDTINLRRFGFTSVLPLGTLDPSAFAVDFFPFDQTDRIIYDDTTGKLYFDQDGTDTAFDQIQFAILTNKPVLTNADFVVV